MPRSAKKRNSKTNLKRLSRKRKMSKTPKRKPRKMKGGGCKSCGSAGLSSNTFKNYMKGIGSNLSGGGYTTNLNGFNIGNRAVVDFYADTNPPVPDLNGNLIMGKGSGSGCGQYGGQSGDLVLDDLKQLSKMSKKSKRKSKTKSKSRSNKSKSRSNKKTKKQKRRKRRRKNKNKMKGGMVMHQKAAFEGPNGKSNFSGNMNDRMFKCSQPNWEPGCI